MKEVNRMAVDPICKMDVDPETARWSSEYEGQNYYFCAPGCKEMFDQDPAKWAGHSHSQAGHGHSCCGGH